MQGSIVCIKQGAWIRIVYCVGEGEGNTQASEKNKKYLSSKPIPGLSATFQYRALPLTLQYRALSTPPNCIFLLSNSLQYKVPPFLIQNVTERSCWGEAATHPVISAGATCSSSFCTDNKVSSCFSPAAVHKVGLNENIQQLTVHCPIIFCKSFL